MGKITGITLSLEDVARLRRYCGDRVTHQDLADYLGCSKATIQNAVKGNARLRVDLYQKLMELISEVEV